MALDFTLAIDTDLSPRAVLRLLGEETSPVGQAALSLDLPAVIVTGHVFDARVRQWLFEPIGFDARLALSFRLDKFALDQASQTMAESVLTLLDSVSGDALFYFQSDQILLQRLSGLVTIDSSTSYFRGVDLDVLGASVTFAPLPCLE